MRVQLVLRFCSQPARLSCKDSVIPSLERKQHSFRNNNVPISGIASSQRGASTLVLALFVVAVLVTAVVGLVFGHKLGYQRGSIRWKQKLSKQSSIALKRHKH
ncbi:hypothetical protein [Psychrobacter sp. JCM 18901]|uniref:hypothetical protein n=1 Tax=Psychrobacter sp. JCM 18901 TaxID=1298609 RepID=UPI0021C4291E|nr:hypothetical protein [Psychrobacter sp. JCM 18901]